MTPAQAVATRRHLEQALIDLGRALAEVRAAVAASGEHYEVHRAALALEQYVHGGPGSLGWEYLYTNALRYCDAATGGPKP